MSVIRVGSTGKYADGWDHIFGGGKKQAGSARGKAAGSKPAKKPAAKPAGTKKAVGKKAAKRK